MGIEQITSSFCVITIFLAVFNAFDLFGHSPFQVIIIREAILVPSPHWPGAVLAGVAFGFVSFFAVFIFLFKGRTATFTGLVTRLTSLIAGTTATVIFHFGFGGKFPKLQDWISFVFILLAVYFVAKAEKKRAEELTKAKEIEV